MVIDLTVKTAEVFYIKLGNICITKLDSPLNKNVNIWLYSKYKVFKVFHKAVNNKVNVIITRYNTESKCLDDILEEYYEQNKRLD